MRYSPGKTKNGAKEGQQRSCAVQDLQDLHRGGFHVYLRCLGGPKMEIPAGTNRVSP